jgi:hypothetical protein
MSDDTLYKRWTLALWKWITRRALRAGCRRGDLQEFILFISDAPRKPYGIPEQDLREMLKVDEFGE